MKEFIGNLSDTLLAMLVPRENAQASSGCWYKNSSSCKIHTPCSWPKFMGKRRYYCCYRPGGTDCVEVAPTICCD
ncbi:hypothetical protein ETD86_42450 [Nonomuraea turkmeniaca]|uniref:Uncharacterized protein n=1 Tax=Nonomuraea turkmeniaca TaxID=103838 RepID=A0A5S4F0X3_9ACTN|nr:hypothetical protein [Nonomuraea turkmeniaca]TMR09699.1 hypothetical protein ETD86_42450 [Nonomuraea turkmeniaca]